MWARVLPAEAEDWAGSFAIVSSPALEVSAEMVIFAAERISDLRASSVMSEALTLDWTSADMVALMSSREVPLSWATSASRVSMAGAGELRWGRAPPLISFSQSIMAAIRSLDSDSGGKNLGPRLVLVAIVYGGEIEIFLSKLADRTVGGALT